MKNNRITEEDLAALASGPTKTRRTKSKRPGQTKENLIFIVVALSGYGVIAAALGLIAESVSLALFLPVFAIGLVSRGLVIGGAAFDASEGVYSFFWNLMLIEMVLSMLVGVPFCFMMTLAIDRLPFEAWLFVLWTFATGAVFASANT